MKRALVLLSLLLFIPACKPRGDAIAPDSFRVTVNPLAESKEMIVTQVTIEARGRHLISVMHEGSLEEDTVSPEKDGGVARAELLIVATLVRPPRSAAILQLLMQVKSTGAIVGGPGSYDAGEAEKLSDVLQFKLTDGTLPLRQNHRIGTIQGKPIYLTVN